MSKDQPPSSSPAQPVLRSLAGRNLLFSPADQALYELDDLSAHVWTSLKTGADRQQIERELTSSGATDNEARAAVERALAALAGLPSQSAPAQEPPRTHCQRLQPLHVEIADVRVQLHLSDDLHAAAGSFLQHLRCEPGGSDFQLAAYSSGQAVHFLPLGRAASTCDTAEFLPTLKAELFDAVLQCADYQIAFHAAGLVHDEALTLLVGSPGAGKSTLSLAMVQAGWTLDADDVVLLDEDVRARGIAFPLAAKSGSWDLIGHHWPSVGMSGKHRRPDGIEVRYIAPDSFAQASRRPIRAVILLDRGEGAATEARDIDPVTALSALLAEADNHHHRLTPAGFTALVAMLGEARCFRLTYSDAAEAAEALRKVIG